MDKKQLTCLKAKRYYLKYKINREHSFLEEEKREVNDLNKKLVCTETVITIDSFDIVLRSFNEKHFHSKKYVDFKKNFLELLQDEDNELTKDIKKSINDIPLSIDEGIEKIFEIYDTSINFQNAVLELQDYKEEDMMELVNYFSPIEPTAKFLIKILSNFCIDIKDDNYTSYEDFSYSDEEQFTDSDEEQFTDSDEEQLTDSDEKESTDSDAEQLKNSNEE